MKVADIGVMVNELQQIIYASIKEDDVVGNTYTVHPAGMLRTYRYYIFLPVLCISRKIIRFLSKNANGILVPPRYVREKLQPIRMYVCLSGRRN